MKKGIVPILMFVMFVSGFGIVQADNNNSGAGFAYQAVLRDVNGDVLGEKQVKLTFSLFKDEKQATPAWTQTKTLTTDKFGVVKTIVGKADDDKAAAPGFADINFSASRFWFKVQLQIGEEALREISFAQLPSAPYAETAFSVSFTVPAGTIVAFAGIADSIPEGWLLCDGRELKTSDYPNLSGIILGYWGAAAGGNFKLPDLRGSFLRGLDETRKVDTQANRTIGMKQDYAVDVRNFKGTFQTSRFDHWKNDSTTVVFSRMQETYAKTVSDVGASYNMHGYLVTLTPPAEYTTETRPVNHAVNYIIKY